MVALIKGLLFRILLTFLSVGVECQFENNQFKNMSYREVEQKILESLLKPPYDKRIRPMYSQNSDNRNASEGGTIVEIDMFIRSFDFIDDVNMQYSIQLTFRQRWNDNRLKYDGASKYENYKLPEKLRYLTLPDSGSVWTPDVFFSNEKTAYFHNMLLPNTFLRVFPNGDVLYSARLSMTLSCPMQLRNFPFDEQQCFIRMASYGYTTDDLIFRWKSSSPPLQLTSHLELPRFSLDKFTTDYCDSVTSTGKYSCILMKFRMRRDSSYYNSQIFMPCGMLVVIGWLSFWISRYEPTARVVVLIATLLVMATLIGGFNQTVPKVSYVKASDTWSVASLLFIFAALFQYILVHYLTSCEKESSDEQQTHLPEAKSLMRGNENDGIESVEAKSRNRRGSNVQSLKGIPKFFEYFTWDWFKEQKLGQQLDLISRVVYPLAFLIFNLSYWPQYYQSVPVDV